MDAEQFEAFDKIIQEYKDDLPEDRLKYCSVAIGLGEGSGAYTFTLETIKIKLIGNYVIISGHDNQSPLDERLYPCDMVIEIFRVRWLHIEEQRIAKKDNKEFVY